MTTTLTKEVRDRAVDALRRAHAEGRQLAVADAVDGKGGVCSCYIIGEELGLRLPTTIHRLAPNQDAYEGLVDDLVDVGFYGAHHWMGIALTNDTAKSFAAVADYIESWTVTEEAEAILREAVLVPA